MMLVDRIARSFTSALCLTCGALVLNCVYAAEYFVSPEGSDTSDGVDRSTPFRTLDRAMQACRPGDTLRVLPGVYFESLVIENKGRAGSPLHIVADDPGFGSTVISGARKEIRDGRIAWRSFDQKTGIYFVTHEDGWPARVLADGLDLFPYSSLESLGERKTSKGVGPDQGYFYDEEKRRLFVRLSSEREPADPNVRILSVAPTTGEGFDGMRVTGRDHYNIGILGTNNPPITIEGVTFETPGVAGVYAESSGATIRGCWFRGCRTAVAGTASESRNGAERIIVEYCDFSQEPAFQDAMESRPGDGGRVLWRRKAKDQGLPNDRFKYEIGLVSNAGKGWVIRRNRVHDAFEGLATRAVSWSTDMRVAENIFERICDNGVEVEDHSSGVKIHGNLFIDNFEAISYQPLGGPPWPESIEIEGNVILERNETAAKFSEIAADRGAFKIGISLKNWPRGTKSDRISDDLFQVRGTGLNIRNNAVFLDGGSILKIIGPPEIPLKGVSFVGNVLSAQRLAHGRELPSGHFRFERNLCITDEPAQADWRTAAGAGGKVLIESLPVDPLSIGRQTTSTDSDSRSVAIDRTMNLLKEVGPQAYQRTIDAIR